MQDWILNSARAIGLSHISDNRPCQDNVKTLKKNDVVVAVLSDGCGSAYFSEIGSKLVVDKVSEYLCDNFDDLINQNEIDIKKVIVNLVLENVDKFAKNNINFINNYFTSDLGKRYYDNACNFEIMKKLSKEDAQKLLMAILFDATVLFVAIKGDQCLLGHCGDGFILGYIDGTFEVLSEEPKEGARNETHYPSSIYYLYKGYKDEKMWDYFRINKINPNKYLGFTLMSDGAEKSLVSLKDGESFPKISNNRLLYDILSNETEENAAKYLEDLLLETYRELEINNEIIEVSDDDVSVALILSTDYKFETANEQNYEPINEEENQIKQEQFFSQKLKKVLTKNSIFDYDKFEWLHEVFSFCIEEYIKNPFYEEKFIEYLKNKFYADDEDIKMINFYGKKCGIIEDTPFKIICISGDSNEQ